MNVKLIFTIFFSDFIDLTGTGKFSILSSGLSNPTTAYSFDTDSNGFGIFNDEERK
jgi:hypothetical protein